MIFYHEIKRIGNDKVISNKFIKIFNENFNYLDAKEHKRKSCFKFFFNKALTHNLELNAKSLHDNLLRLDGEEGQDHSKCKKVIYMIRNAYEDCKLLRIAHVAWKHYHYEKYEGPHFDCTTSGYSYDYKTPYKASKFEKELMLALEASIRMLNEEIKTTHDDKALKMKKECCTLLYDISHFSTVEIRKNARSWAP